MLSVIRKMSTACVVCALCVSVGYGGNTPNRHGCHSNGDCKSNCCIRTAGSGGHCGQCSVKDFCNHPNHYRQCH